jgi:hypothetical protein
MLVIRGGAIRLHVRDLPDSDGRGNRRSDSGILQGQCQVEVKMKPSFVRMRKRCRAVLVVPSHLSDLVPHLRQKNFHPIVLPVGVLEQQQKALWLPGRTLITDKPEDLAFDDVPVLEFSLIDITKVKADETAIADLVSRTWTKFRLKTEGWFVLRLRQDGEHQIEFPE